MGITQDLRDACRSLITMGVTSLAVVATIALGIGVNGAIFGVAHTLLRELPFASPERLVAVSNEHAAQPDAGPRLLARPRAAARSGEPVRVGRPLPLQLGQLGFVGRAGRRQPASRHRRRQRRILYHAPGAAAPGAAAVEGRPSGHPAGGRPEGDAARRHQPRLLDLVLRRPL